MKKTFRAIAAFAVSLAMCNVIPITAEGASPSMTKVENDEVLIYISEDDDNNNWGSSLTLQPGRPDANLVRDPWIFCESIDDAICDFDKPNYTPSAGINLRNCESDIAEDCIATLRVIKDGKLLDTEFFGEVPGAKTFRAAPEMGLFQTGKAGLYRAKDAPHDGGDLYLVSVLITSNYDRISQKFVHTDLYTVIIPVSPGRYPIGSSSWESDCIWSNSGDCGFRSNFPSGVSFGVEMRVVNELGGWFLGRMQAPSISVKKFSSRNNTIVVDALPVDVSRFAFLTKKSSLTSADKTAVGNVGGTNGLLEDRPARLANSGFDNTTFGMLSHFREKVADTAVATTTHWRMRTTSRNGGNKCLTDYDQVLGIVSTNATAYDGFAPEFDDGYLDYKVAGLHFLPDGKQLARGTYDLVMRSETARCLYGFSNAPVSATVTVVGAGDQNVSSEIVKEEDGWLKLNAYGFTFSEKEIKVKLTQPYSKTLTKFTGTTKSLSAKQKAEIKATVTKAKSNPKFICTGTYVNAPDKATALARAKAACNYAKSLDKNHSYFAQAKQTSAISYEGKVILVSK